MSQEPQQPEDVQLDPAVLKAAEDAEKFAAEMPEGEAEGLAEVDAEVGRLVLGLSDSDLESAELSIRAIMPESATRSPRIFEGFGDAYLSVVLENLCCPDKEFRKDVDAALDFGSGKASIAICTALTVTGVPLTLAVPIVAALLRFGVDAVCKHFKDQYNCEPEVE